MTTLTLICTSSAHSTKLARPHGTFLVCGCIAVNVQGKNAVLLHDRLTRPTLRAMGDALYGTARVVYAVNCCVMHTIHTKHAMQSRQGASGAM